MTRPFDMYVETHSEGRFRSGLSLLPLSTHDMGTIKLIAFSAEIVCPHDFFLNDDKWLLICYIYAYDCITQD